jgi:hypothetical protein
MEITEQQFLENMDTLPDQEQSMVIGLIDANTPEALEAFASSLGVTFSVEDVADETIEEPVDTEMEPTLPLEEPVVEEAPIEEPPVPVESPMDQQMQQLAMGDQVVEPVPEEAMPTEAMPTEAVPMEAAPVDAVAGPIMQPGASETGVADDVPMDAEEGAYVVNAAAIERVGVRDFEERILKPNIESLRKKGVEISLEQLKSPAAQVEGDTDVAVSNGEYYLPPVLVKEIGLDLLEKINKRGEQETEERIAEEEAPVEPMQQQVQALKKGQRVKKNTRDEEIARTIVAEAGVFKTKEAMQKVLNVMVNRTKAYKFTDNKGKEVKTLQDNLDEIEFSGYKSQKNKKLDKNQLNIARELVKLSRQDKLKDLTDGATNFWNPNTATSTWFKDNIANNKDFELTATDKLSNTVYQHDYYKRKPVVAPLPPKKPIPQSTPIEIPYSDTSKIEEIPFR